MRRLLHPDLAEPLPTGSGEQGDPTDESLLAALDGTSEAWGRLSEFASGWAVEEGDAHWNDRHWVYGPRVAAVTTALNAVGAVPPSYDWNAFGLPLLAMDGTLTPPDAIRTATALLRRERFVEGTLATAWMNGRLYATIRALVHWHETGTS
ncbi:DUF6508 domain-containing protein [Streptacidiphilus pinicola]|nr:DUF6508 domain-containing protein [Streptacidiphilus pinicola]